MSCPNWFIREMPELPVEIWDMIWLRVKVFCKLNRKDLIFTTVLTCEDEESVLNYELKMGAENMADYFTNVSTDEPSDEVLWQVQRYLRNRDVTHQKLNMTRKRWIAADGALDAVREDYEKLYKKIKSGF